MILRGIREVKANADWIAAVKNKAVELKSPSDKLQSSLYFEVSDLNKIEKEVIDLGDNDESITWTFFLQSSSDISFESFGEIDLDSLANYITSSFKVPFIVRNIDTQGKEISNFD
ncbi:hypothetical protein BGP78_00010 [Pseudoalteromonas sp. MSK9-3]|uniref:hypothetical protein n=1 Tax=Pseudoalteromonas sp. MSK9-3 TaxID=1897633 RepID=UPI000E6B57D7|nr:hypothetical protein [Pseudoalteromonas sp. MSK9-3]RJE77425.1 hypothetical protein BGP78_00010 [Pseudoalteromonas sp. MSK9-3]